MQLIWHSWFNFQIPRLLDHKSATIKSFPWQHPIQGSIREPINFKWIHILRKTTRQKAKHEYTKQGEKLWGHKQHTKYFISYKSLSRRSNYNPISKLDVTWNLNYIDEVHLFFFFFIIFWMRLFGAGFNSLVMNVNHDYKNNTPMFIMSSVKFLIDDYTVIN